MSKLLVNTFLLNLLIFIKRQVLNFIIGIGFLSIFSCNVLSKISAEKPLYAGGILEVDEGDTLKLAKGVSYELEDQIYPKPNSKILGGRFGLSLYFKYVDRKDELKFIKKFLYDKFSEEPVYYDDEISKKVKKNIEDELYNNGYFYGTVDYKTHKEKDGKLVYVTYTAHPNDHPYTINSFVFEGDSTLLQKAIIEELDKSIFHEKPRYDLDLLKSERKRVEDSLRNNGYYFFKQGFLTYEADSALGTKSVDLFMKLKSNFPPKASRKFYIGEITMNTDFQQDSSKAFSNHVEIDTLGYIYQGDPHKLKPKALKDAILFERGELYKQNKHRNTLKLLSSLGVFSYIDLAFKETTDSLYFEDLLDVSGRMTQVVPKSISTEIGMATWTNGYTGPELELSWQHRNIFGGAETFSFSADIGILQQFGGSQSSDVTSIQLLGIDFSLTFPRILFPFPVRLYKESILPSTKISLSYETYWYRPIAQLRIINSKLTYDWSPNFNKRHILDLIDIVFQNSEIESGTEVDSLDDFPNFGIPRIENENIFSSKYTYQYRSGKITEQDFVLGYQGYIDAAGNIIYGLQKAFGKNPTQSNPETFLGQVYAQYVRVGSDLRSYLQLNRKFTLASRINVDVGVPWGNATELPFIRSYFVGGPTSIKSFNPRTIGPGSAYVMPGDNEYFERDGDIKIEANIELRQSLSKFFKLGYFIDIGNVWLLNKNPNFINGDFDFSRFYKELAIGTGIGFRLDLEFFVLRLDLGVPVLTPFLSQFEDDPDTEINEAAINAPVSDRFLLKDFPSGIVFNLAIGYPF
ncbi:translocation and assembly module lipoprotein TamL [Sediminitomix flava]|uniref:Outer membrane protein assembly factor BamA n=1 Tax=Sediminitomix flava TaxID=379075 RepID=A0A315ZAH3_SEDFL|nr:BamA/TamA family outer membrane protein [Sediminitomix flava]PWJ42340.1 outer membrane protein assembly factor BamA [Sediminitomix flava]